MAKYKDKHWLRQQYVENNCTQAEIAEKAGCSQHTVSRWLREYDIDTRDISDYTEVLSPIWHPKGYIEFRDQSNGCDDRFYHHRLTAVAEYGFDAVVGKDVHHKNGIGWANWAGNIELLEPGEHMSKERMKDVERGVQLEERFNESQ